MLIWLRKTRPILISVIGYLSFTLAISLLFLYLRFPFKGLEKRAITLLEEKASIKLEIKEALFRPPVKYIWKGVRFSIQEIQYLKGIELDLISARLNILPLLKKRIVTDLKAEGIGGIMNGRLVAWREQRGFLYYIKGDAANIELGRMILTDDQSRDNIAGRLRLGLDYSWSDDDLIRGDGIFDLEVSGLKIKDIEVNRFPIKEISFSSILGRMNLKGGVVNIERLTARTTDIDLAGGGNIIVGDRFVDSILNLTFHITIKGDGPNAKLLALFAPPNKERPVVLAIKGNVGHPLYYLNDLPLNR